MTKRTIKEAFIIVLLGIALAIAFNIYSPKGIPLIPKEKKVEIVSDEDLFGNENRRNTFDTVSQTKTNSKNIEIEEKKSKQISKNSNINDSSLEEENLESKPKENKKVEESSVPNDEKLDDFPSVDYRQMLKIIESEEFYLIDARNREQYAKDRIGDAVNIFPYDEMDLIMDKVFQIPEDKKIVVYCDGGSCDSSHKISEILREFGFEKVYIYTGGWEEWIIKRNES